jgi:acyl-CoA synthetase (AMP-forming)/AMP-acid ligase II
MITPLPIFHMNAMAYSFMAMVAVGGCLTVLDRFHPSSWWRSVRESGATCLHYLGRHAVDADGRAQRNRQ